MLMRIEDMAFLSRTTTEGKNGVLIAKENLSDEDKERLLEIDEANLMTYGEHLISNYKGL